MPSACRECAHPSEEGQRFCRGCGADLAGKPEAREAASLPPLAPPRSRGKPGFGWFLIGIFALGILSAIATPSYRRAPIQARKKACVSNMKTIEGAVELYFMEHDRDRAPTPDLRTLKVEGYLKSEPLCSANGVYSIRVRPSPPAGAGGRSARPFFTIECSIHGGIDDTTSGL